MTSVSQLSLEHIRGVLMRLEETIIFGLIERVQFRHNPIVYVKGGLGVPLGDESLLGFLLRETERAHAQVRRYTSPDEQPFFAGLPVPILPTLEYADNPLHPNRINVNDRIRAVYESEIVPFFCVAGDDSQYGSSAVADVPLLQTLSKRVHYGKFVAESKYRQRQTLFDPLIRARDSAGIERAITDLSVETTLFARLQRKTATYNRELETAGEYTIPPASVSTLYRRWIIPMNKDVQVQYLLGRLDPRPG